MATCDALSQQRVWDIIVYVAKTNIDMPFKFEIDIRQSLTTWRCENDHVFAKTSDKKDDDVSRFMIIKCKIRIIKYLYEVICMIDQLLKKHTDISPPDIPIKQVKSLQPFDHINIDIPNPYNTGYSLITWEELLIDSNSSTYFKLYSDIHKSCNKQITDWYHKIIKSNESKYIDRLGDALYKCETVETIKFLVKVLKNHTLQRPMCVFVQETPIGFVNILIE
jgi:hypothetical protein